MTFDGLMQKILEILPDACMLAASDGELVIYTNLSEPVVGAPLVEIVPDPFGDFDNA
jgi:hypothetical protein